MNLEPIDTSTTAGKAEVMRLAAKGRTVAMLPREKAAATIIGWTSLNGDSDEWDWPNFEYAIIAEPVGLDEVWVVYKGAIVAMGHFGDGQLAVDRAEDAGPEYTAVRYVRAEQ